MDRWGTALVPPPSLDAVTNVVGGREREDVLCWDMGRAESGITGEE